MKILYATSEATPFARTGGLGDVAGALPKALKGLGHDARVIMPLYEEIPQEFRQLMVFKGTTFIDLAWRKQYCGIFEATYEGTTYYFIDNEYYFKRRGLYGHFDDGERFAFFSKAVLEVMHILDFIPDILHCNDWQTALCPVFLDVFFRFAPEYQHIKTVYTIHNIEFQGQYSKDLLADLLGLTGDAAKLAEYKGDTNYMKGGIESAAAVTTVSETYAKEILDPYYANGLESILRARTFKIHGVVNGIDADVYSPAKDKALFENYTLKTIAKKEANKKGLCELVNLPYSPDKPMLSMVTRLTEQKGLDLVAAVLEQILSADIQMVVLGKGDWKYEAMFKGIEAKYPSKFRAIINFSADLASKIYAASDLFLMPSKFEPCGLSQMIAMNYGAVPIVRETGGLKDTVDPFNPDTLEGTGFTFKTYNAGDMLDAVWRAVQVYFDKPKFKAVRANGMKRDFSWTASAKKYVTIYESI